jgi:hypothetical protein
MPPADCKKEEYDMQCYQYLAAITAVANTIESVPGIPHKLPLSVIAEWMANNDIEAEDVLFATAEQIAAVSNHYSAITSRASCTPPERLVVRC